MRGLSLAKKNAIMRAAVAVSVAAEQSMKPVATVQFSEIVAYNETLTNVVLSKIVNKDVRARIAVIRDIIKTYNEGMRLKTIGFSNEKVLTGVRNRLMGYLRTFYAIFGKKVVFA